MSACAVVAAMLFAATPAPEVGPRVVVIVQGDADAGKPQALLEDDLDKQGVRIVRNAGPKLGPPPEPALSTTQTDLAMVEIKAAQAAYDAAEFEAAMQSVDRARAILSTTTELAASEARVQMHLWAAAIKLAAGKPDADVEIKSLVRLDPDARVNTDIFPPEVAQLVETHRPKDLVSVALSGLPDGAIVVVTPPGGLPRLEKSLGFAAEKGARIRIRASHYRAVEFTVPEGPTFPRPVKMALALRDDGDKAMRALLETGVATKQQISTLTTLGTQAGADALVLVAARGAQSRGAVVWTRSGDVKVSKPGDAASVTKFVSSVLRPSTGSALLGERDNGIFTTGGVAVSMWNRNLDGVMQYSLNGAGPALSVDFRRNGLIANAGLEYITYSLTPIEITVTGGSTGEERLVTGEGGSALRVSLDGGYDVAAGPVMIGALLGGRFEQYSMTNVEIDGLTALGSSTYSGGLVRLRALYPIGDAIRVSGSAGVFVAPSYVETPKGTSGTDPKAASAPFWRLGASWQTSKLRVGFDYAGEVRSIALEGPPLVDRRGGEDEGDLTLTEMVNTFSLTAAYRF